MGDFEVLPLGGMESTVRYHFSLILILTLNRYPVREQYQAGSLTGAVASQNVTEAFTKVG